MPPEQGHLSQRTTICLKNSYCAEHQMTLYLELPITSWVLSYPPSHKVEQAMNKFVVYWKLNIQDWTQEKLIVNYMDRGPRLPPTFPALNYPSIALAFLPIASSDSLNLLVLSTGSSSLGFNLSSQAWQYQQLLTLV